MLLHKMKPKEVKWILKIQGIIVCVVGEWILNTN